jgi:hypothetical protein
MTLTCFDADTISRLKDTVDVVLPKEEYDRTREHTSNKTAVISTFDKFGLKSCELTLSKTLLTNAKRACDRRRRY